MLTDRRHHVLLELGVPLRCKLKFRVCEEVGALLRMVDADDNVLASLLHEAAHELTPRPQNSLQLHQEDREANSGALQLLLPIEAEEDIGKSSRGDGWPAR